MEQRSEVKGDDDLNELCKRQNCDAARQLRRLFEVRSHCSGAEDTISLKTLISSTCSAILCFS